MNLQRTFHKVLISLPYFGKKLKLLKDCGYEPGHYYSTIPNLEEIRERRSKIFNKNNIDLKDININREMQFALLKNFAAYYKELPYDFFNPVPSQHRYGVLAPWYTYSDAIMLYSMLRHFKPARIIEIGSGHSSALMMDVNDLFFNSKISMTFIDPDIARLKSKMRGDDESRYQVIPQVIQDVETSIFKQLGENDVLFIDSSHVSKAGSDLNHIIFEILPILNKGVLIHFHDIHYPFELPEHWILERKRFWNENYMVRALLTGNPNYEIVNFNTYLHHEFNDWIKENMPACLINSHEVGSIWLRKK